MTIEQVYYQNPDLTIAYQLVCSENGVIGFGGEVHEGATLLAAQEDIDAANSALQASISNSMAQAQAAADLAEAEDYADRLSIAQAFVAANVLTVEQAEIAYNVEIP